MYYSLLVFPVLLAVVTAGRSPHADLVDKLERSPEGGRYSSNVFEDGRLDLESVIRKYQYPYESHHVLTEDGYILGAVRIPHGRDQNNQPGSKPVVLILHGLLSSSADFVLLGPGHALSYMLAEEGYDVWLLNSRGNFHSRNHTTLDPNRRGDPSFWAFSWEEMGRFDLPAYIDYILEVTGQEKVHFIGHSQGATSFLTGMSLRPEYNEKIISFQGLAPAAFFYNNRNPVFLNIAPFERVLEVSELNFILILPKEIHCRIVGKQSLAGQLGIYEILGRNDLLTPLLMQVCRDGIFTQTLCKLLVQYDRNDGIFNTKFQTMFPAFLGHAPSGSSIRQLTHYGQNIRFGTFSRFHYGHIQNLITYGRVNPPPFNLNLITARSYLHYALSDFEADYRDVLLLEELLPNARAIQVPRAGFTHIEFIWGMDAREQVYETALQMMREAESLQ
ncbi:lipase 1-like [Cydia fagiglandana]|uniref:lipase 1-like n=1 Tax=Cydia fagiglandana TaxID=1458189 RepID=UPI002FEE27D8